MSVASTMSTTRLRTVLDIGEDSINIDLYVCQATTTEDLYNEDTIGTTVNSPVQWNLYNEDTIGTTVNSPVQ